MVNEYEGVIRDIIDDIADEEYYSIVADVDKETSSVRRYFFNSANGVNNPKNIVNTFKQYPETKKQKYIDKKVTEMINSGITEEIARITLDRLFEEEL